MMPLKITMPGEIGERYREIEYRLSPHTHPKYYSRLTFFVKENLGSENINFAQCQKAGFANGDLVRHHELVEMDRDVASRQKSVVAGHLLTNRHTLFSSGVLISVSCTDSHTVHKCSLCIHNKLSFNLHVYFNFTLNVRVC